MSSAVNRPRRSELGAQRGVVFGAGLVGVIILAFGFLGFLRFEPVGQHSGVHAEVIGVFATDPATGLPLGKAESTFRPDQPFVAVVDWSALPPDLVVAARWYDALGSLVGGQGPAPAGTLALQPPVGTTLEAGGRPNLPGDYLFVVERWSDGRPVEVLARSAAVVVSS
jgi:hypothetical protein